MRASEFIVESKGIFIESKGTGDCFEAALKELLNNDDKSGMTLVHAAVTGQGKIEGIKHGHAWNEIGDIVIDKSNGRNIVMRKEEYYDIGKIDPTNDTEFKRYTRPEMAKKVQQFETYGPWELSHDLAENSYKGDGSPGMVMGIASDARGDTNTYEDRTDEYKINNQDGLGSVPNNNNIDYIGFRAQMLPSKFLQLALPLKGQQSDGYPELVKKIEAGSAIGSPFLTIKIPDEWEDGEFTLPTKITGHEGRHRMMAIQELEGDVPVEVHVWGRFESAELRRRHLTDEIFHHLEKGLINETGTAMIADPFISIKR